VTNVSAVIFVGRDEVGGAIEVAVAKISGVDTSTAITALAIAWPRPDAVLLVDGDDQSEVDNRDARPVTRLPPPAQAQPDEQVSLGIVVHYPGGDRSVKPNERKPSDQHEQELDLSIAKPY
jgi:hypothetical protein